MRHYPQVNEDELDELDEPKPYRYYEQQVCRRIQHFYLSKPIGEPEQFIDMIHKIQTASAEDVIYLHLNTPGGNLATGVQLVNALRSTQAHTIAALESEAHSLGTLIFLAADEFVVHDNVMMMFHNFSGITIGKGNEQQAYLEASIRWFNDLAKTLYIPFLTEDEFDRILRGEDLYFHSDEIRTRLDKLVEAIKEEQEAAEEKAVEELEKVEEVIKSKVTSKKKTEQPDSVE